MKRLKDRCSSFGAGDYMKENKISKLLKKILEFRDKRDWAQFHDPKNLAEAISIEASELLEHFLWKTAKESRKISAKKKKEIASEIADILIFSMLFAHETGIDIEKAIKGKINLNDKRYPVEKAKGSAKKCTEF